MANVSENLKTYEELTFSDDFMFCKVLQNNPDLCRELTELILGQEIGSIAYIAKQHPIEITADGHGVRFDIYMKDDRNTRYDIEMQTSGLPELPKRTRYYQSMIDLEALEHSRNYRELPDSYVIFISLQNPFPNVGLHKYTFMNRCKEETDLCLEDGAQRIFISAEGNKEDVSDEMSSFLRYLTDQSTDSDLTRRLEEAVQKAKTRQEWSVEYMTLYEMKQMEREAGLKEGLKRGWIDSLLEMVRDGLVSFDAAAEKAKEKYNIREDDFQKMLDDFKSEKVNEE